MLDKLRYDDVNSLKNYIESWIIPLLEQSNVMRKYFKEIDDDLAKYTEEIHLLSKKIVGLAEEKLSLKLSPKYPHEPKDIYETIERGRFFLEKAFNLTIPCNPYTFFVWSIRKITKSYLKMHYPKLFNGNKLKGVTTILGLRKYWEPPQVKPKQIVEDYSLYAYLDYETKEKYSEESIGGLISKLNKKILFELLFSYRRIKAFGTLYQIPDLFEEYRKTVDETLDRIDWKRSDVASLLRYVYRRHYYYEYENRTKVPLHACIEGIFVVIEENERCFTLFRFLDEIMPLQMLGGVELAIERVKSKYCFDLKINFKVFRP